MDGYKVKTSAFLKHVQKSAGIIAVIAGRMGISREHLTRWLNKNPTLWEYVYNERENLIDLAETKLVKKLEAEQDWAIKFILGSTNRGKRRGYNDIPQEKTNDTEFVLVSQEEAKRAMEALKEYELRIKSN